MNKSGATSRYSGKGPAVDSICAGSFRDRTARIVEWRGDILRCLDVEADGHWQKLKSTTLFRDFVADGRLVGTRETELPEGLPPEAVGLEPRRVLRHDRVPFVTYPYEWPFGMLKDAALLQLDLLLAALHEGMTVKDGTPYNVQWRGVSPVFIDIPSLTAADPGRPWDGYRQFCELCLFPLMLEAYRGFDFHAVLRGSLEGISSEAMSALMGARDWLRPGVLTHVKLQSWLSRRYAETAKDVGGEVRNAGFSQAMVETNAKRLRKTVSALTWKMPESAWRDYESDCHYAKGDRRQKREFVEAQARRRAWKTAWDLGCNAGEYSRLISSHGDRVIAMDADHSAVESLYRRLRNEGPGNVLPLVMNLADPSPGLGWRNAERSALVQRGRPDFVLCLALIHHAVIGSHIPLHEFVAWLAELRGRLVIEFVDRSDPMVRKLLANKDDRYSDYELAVFEEALDRHFRVEERLPLGSGNRVLYAATPRSVIDG